MKKITIKKKCFGNVSLTWKIIVSFLLLSSVFTLFATGFQLYRDYRQDVGLINERLDVIQKSYLDSLARSLWDVNEEQIGLQLKGILSLSDIEFVDLRENTMKFSLSIGEKIAKSSISRTYPLQFSPVESETIVLGELTVVATLENVRVRLMNKVLLILITQATKTFFASFCFFAIIYFLLTRHLKTITHYLHSMSEKASVVPLTLTRKTAMYTGDDAGLAGQSGLPKKTKPLDELDQVVSAINEMNGSINQKVKALRVSEEKYRAVVENIGDSISRYDRSGNHIYANSSALQSKGLTEIECVGKGLKELGTPDDLSELIEEKIESVFTKGTQKNIEFETEQDGRLKILELQLNPEFADDGSVHSVVGIARDITERKKIERELRDSIAILDEVVRAGRIGLWNWNLKTNSVSFSKEWKRQIGYQEHEISDEFSEWEIRVHPDDLEKTLAAVQKGIEEIDQEYRVEFRFRHKNGSYRWILAQASFTLDKDGKPTQMLGTHIDVTEQRELEVELQQSQKMESIGTLAGGIAHDFNNILSSVLGFTELALGGVEKKTTVEEDLQEVYAAGLRAKELVQQILTFARKSEETLKPIKVASVIVEVLKFIRSSIPATIEIKQTINSETLVMASSSQLHRIMMNLCTNAAQAMDDEGGTLEVSLKNIRLPGTHRETLSVKPGNYVEIKVSDTGCGIEPHIINKIFEPYFSTKGPGDGTGMGLAMVHGIVENYGGKVLVESVPGKGSVFLVYLPEARGQKSKQPYKVKELPTGHERILFVDDEGQIAKIGSRILEELGYTVTIRTCSVDALELFRSKPLDFDLVISDVTMPRMTGDELAKELMQIRPEIPIILCTGYSKKFTEENALEIGVKGFAYKPIIKEDLVTKVRQVLDGHV